MITVLLALASALAFAVSTVVQHRTAADAGSEGGGGLTLLGRLLRRPAWLAGQATALLGLVLHALALRGGMVVLVQPLLATGLVFTLTLGALADRRHPGRPLPGHREWTAAGVLAAGLALFTTAAHPLPGAATAPAAALVGAVGGGAVIALAASLWSRRPGAPHRAMAFGIAAGIGFGVTGLLLKQVVARPGSWASTWALLALLLTGGLAVLMAQRAYQAGPLSESVPVMAVLEPVLAAALAGPLYGERLAPGFLAHAGQLAGTGVLLAGLLLLARSSVSATGPRLPDASAGAASAALSAR